MESGLPDKLRPGDTEDVLGYFQILYLHKNKVLKLTVLKERVETLMCYHGVGDTFTAAHKGLCSSSGQNLMCATEKDGSSD